jgi:citrate synthase
MAEQAASYSPGLEGIVAGISTLSYIDTENNVLTYRGYNVQDLCDNCSFEEVAYLLLYGELPNEKQFEAFNATLIAEREPHPKVYEVIKQLPPSAEPMDWLKVAVATQALFDPQADDNSREANLAKAIRLTAKLPTILANGYKLIDRAPYVQGLSTDSHAANFLRMLTNESPDELSTKTLNTTLILYAEHGYNASTFSARVTVSTLSDLYSGVVSAIGTLKGSLHGGANEEVMRMLLEIGDPAKAEAWVTKRLTKSPDNPRPRIMGFGHREYKVGDQRAQIVKGYTRQLAEQTGVKKWVEISDILEEYMLREKGLHPNLDFPVSPAYYMMGLPIPLYTPIFVLSRIVGWSAHIIEQLDNNRLIRPTNLYAGPERREFVAIGNRA